MTTTPARRRTDGSSGLPRTAARGKGRRFSIVTGILLASLGGLAVLSLGIGRIAIPPGTVTAILASRIAEVEPFWPAAQEQIVIGVRLPRIIAAMLVGAALAAAGAAYQTLFRNPIVSPDVLGVSAGAGFGASLAVTMNLGAAAIQMGAFAMGLAAVGLCFAIGQTINRHSLIVLVLVGVVIAAFFQAMISVLKIVADPIDVLPVITFWLLGGLNKVTPGDLPLVAALIGLALGVLMALRWQVNVVSVGPEEARMLGIDLVLAEGEVLCLLGPNGAGKTTLLRCLIGGLRPSAGRILLGGQELGSLSPRALARRMAYVPQASPPAFGHLVREMVVMGRSAHLGRFDTPGRADHERAEAALERVGLGHLSERSFAEISGGERQLCLLARALAQEARLLVLDEPAASLDFGNQLRLLEIVAGLRRDGLGILMCTHHPDHALQVGTRFLALQEGAIHAAGPATDLARPGYLTSLYGRGVRVIRDGDGALACVPILTVPEPEIHHVP